ncbi:tetratricopeptide repeat protein (macronuclear) [Tetrahymena thermophila SB210]|uniref:Tetratricopeptide repeat protein n=1 Tax=Tetrahymena thermophila (strain SB210) TaxID=312017 RepID=Q232Q2_TETTS|nr:tetratricopeptide repeat protein [Tetrahymena thermophila SB210]EAR91500.1 tetratricopeptide repeat protein [Tetrahymena thermophila SB210]|eukprot:XP_001011745.1 tetratricopeptide repeat protein [Tetrahymena thermophila SB210]
MNCFNFDEDMHVFQVNQKIEVLKCPLQTIKQQIDNKLKENPNDLYSLAIKCQIEYEYNLNYRNALEIIKLILKQDKNNVDARLDLVSIMFKFKLKQIRECFSLIDECLQIANQYWRTNYIKSVILSENVDLNDSIFVLKKLYEQEPQNIFILCRLSQFLSEDPLTQNESLKLLNKAKSIGIYDYDILRRISYSEFSLKNYEITKKLLQRAIQLNPNSSICYENLAYHEYKVLNDLQKSEELYLKSIELDNFVYESHTQLAYINLNKKNIEDAVKYFKKCIQIKSDRSPTPYSELAVIYSNDIKDNDKSYYYLQKGLQQFKNCPYMNLIAVMQRQDEPFRQTYKDLEEDEHSAYITLNQSNKKNIDYTCMLSILALLY